MKAVWSCYQEEPTAFKEHMVHDPGAYCQTGIATTLTGRVAHPEAVEEWELDDVIKKGKCLNGLPQEPFSGKAEYLDRLVNEEHIIELTVSYSRGPLRQPHGIHSVYRPSGDKTSGEVARLPYQLPTSQ